MIEFKPGDIIAEHGHKWLSRQIQYFMRIYTEKMKHQKYRVLFNHIAVVIEFREHLWIAEALGFGVRTYPIEESGYLTNKNIIIKRHRLGFSQEQRELVTYKMLSMGGVRYQIEAFLQYVGKIWFRFKNMFIKENERAVNCSELGAIAINTVYPNTFKITDGISPMDFVMDNTNFETIDNYGLLN